MSQRMALLLEAGEEVLTPYEELLKRYDVAGLIRIPEAEFVEIGSERPVLAHFNLGATIHEAGQHYLLVKLVRHGSYKTAEADETPPLLSLAGARVMRCLVAEHRLSLASLGPPYFEHAFEGITDRSSLASALLRRYGTSTGGITMADIEAKGVAFTLLEDVLQNAS